MPDRSTFVDSGMAVRFMDDHETFLIAKLYGLLPPEEGFMQKNT
jgi:hypothetical protein